MRKYNESSDSESPGRIEHFLLSYIHKHSDIEVERSVIPESLSIDETQIEERDGYPITVTLKHLKEEDSTPEFSNGVSQGMIDGSNVPNGLFRSNIAADDTDQLLGKADATQKRL